MTAGEVIGVLKAFAELAGVVPDLVDLFVAEKPELIAPPDSKTPPEEPAGDLSPTVLAEIERGEL